MISAKISIVTVSYNCANTIRRTIESVLSQKYQNVEYIIIDGGSTDGTVEILEEYDEKIFFWCSESDNGIYDAMNKGIRKCTGDLIAFLNSDDWFDKNILGEVDNYYKSSNADILYGDYVRVEENGDRNLIRLNDVNLQEMHYKWFFCHQAMFFKRQLFDTIGLYDLSYNVSADYELILRAYVQKAKFTYIPKTICFFSLGGFCKSHMKECARDVKRLCTKYVPKEVEKEYLGKINDNYERVMNGVCLENLKNKLILGETVLVEKLKNSLLPKYDRLCIFGAGRVGRKFVKIFLNLSVKEIFVMDNNSMLWGQKIEGVEIINPCMLNENVMIVIAVKYGKEILIEQLLEMGYYREEIVMYEEIEEIIVRDLGGC